VVAVAAAAAGEGGVEGGQVELGVEYSLTFSQRIFIRPASFSSDGGTITVTFTLPNPEGNRK